MAKTIIEERLKFYAPASAEEEQDALKEILQEIILCGLADTDFFEKAVFQGGSSLRIIHGMPRFSEDLDFILEKPESEFVWEYYSRSMEDTCRQYGLIPELVDKSKTGLPVKKLFLKDTSIGKVVHLSFARNPRQKFKIKLEIDTNPPAGSESEIRFIDFPLACAVKTQDLSSNFAGKCHALLCRKYAKGRDWYDLTWHVKNKVSPNLTFLSNALAQSGPWARKNIRIKKKWFIDNLEKKIISINWRQVKNDVAPFLKRREKQSLRVWGKPFFLDVLQKLNSYL